MYDHIYLSPHYDDAALSCGGAIHRQRRAGHSVLVVTVCAAPPAPDEALSPVARDLHRGMGNPADLVAARRDEDREAMRIVGADVLWLDFADCIYRRVPGARGWAYPDLPSVFGRVHPGEAALPDAMAEAVDRLVRRGPGTTVYAPLAVGGHVDHQLVRRAASLLRLPENRLAFYEDYPYADAAYPHPYDPENAATLEAVMSSLDTASLQPRLVYLEEDDVRAKVESIRAYRSQTDLLFGDDASVAARVRAFALRHDGRRPAERYWFPDRDFEVPLKHS